MTAKPSGSGGGGGYVPSTPSTPGTSSFSVLPAKKPRYTLADVLTGGNNERVEIIDGEAVMMAPPPSSAHQEISMELSAQLHAYLKGKKCRVYAAPYAVIP